MEGFEDKPVINRPPFVQPSAKVFDIDGEYYVTAQVITSVPDGTMALWKLDSETGLPVTGNGSKVVKYTYEKLHTSGNHEALGSQIPAEYSELTGEEAERMRALLKNNHEVLNQNAQERATIESERRAREGE